MKKTTFASIALALLVPLGAWAQAAEAKKTEPAKPAEEAKTESKDAPAADAGATAAPEDRIVGMFDFGYRWHTNVGGDFNTYRSVVNLGEGPKLFGADFSIGKTGKLFDRVDVRANGWGGDPWTTTRVDVTKRGAYNFSADYRNLALFNYLPSYANPKLATGSFLSQRAFDTLRRSSEVELELHPGSRFVPYFGWSHNSGSGRGITDFVADQNEYPVASLLSDKTDLYRGGVRMEFRKWHFGLEQGGLTFNDDTSVFNSTRNLGNRTTTLFGQQLQLTNLLQAYKINGNSIFSKATFAATPFDWMDVNAQFLYSRPTTDSTYNQTNNGNFVILSSLLFYNGQQGLTSADAKMPHSSGNLGVEVRPFRRVRILESFLTDRLHNASSLYLTEQILLSGNTSQNRTFNFNDRLIYNYNQNQTDVLVDVTKRLTLRGGYRALWGDAQVRSGNLNPIQPLESAKLKRQAGLAGLNFRASEKLSINYDLEAASGDKTWFRVSMQDYTRSRLRARYQAFTNLTFSGVYSVLNNENPSPGVNYKFNSKETSLSMLWTPQSGKRISILGEYTRSTLESDINYPMPQSLSPARSFYLEKASTAVGLLDLVGPKVGTSALRLSVGGSMFISGGSRPSDYYEPLFRLYLPMQKHVTLRSEWRWYSLGQTIYNYEGFRTHIFLVSLQLAR